VKLRKGAHLTWKWTDADQITLSRQISELTPGLQI